MKAQSGFALLEAVAGAGIAAICAGTLILALSGVAKFGAHANGPNRAAALALARQTLRTAQNAWKYGSPGEAPAGTTDLKTLGAHVTATLARGEADGADLSVTVSYTPDPGRADPGSVTITGHVRALAPLPGSQIDRPGLVAQPAQ